MDIKKVVSVIVLFSLMLIIPRAIAIKTFEVQETDLVTLSPEALDPDNDAVTYSYSPPLDAQGRWQTGYDDAGEYLLKIRASDGVNQSTKEVLLVVKNKNQPPQLTERKLKVKERQQIDLKPFVADPDQDPLEYTFTKPFDKAGLWTPDYDDQGTFVAKFSVSDGDFSVPARLEIEVLNTNQPPLLSDSFSEESKVSVQENELFTFFVEAEDGDSDALSYSWVLNGVTISHEKQGEYFFDFEDAGAYELSVMINDQHHQIEQKWAVQVENINRRPEAGLKPVTAEEGELAILQLPEKDLDGDILTYTFEEKFDPQGVWQTTYDDAGEHIVQYSVSDGLDEVEGKAEVTVLNVDRAPEVSLPAELQVHEGEHLSFVLNVSDLDGDEVTVSFENAPEGSFYDSETKEFSWSPGYDYIKRKGGMLSNILNALRLEHRFLREKNLLLEMKVCSRELCSTFTVPFAVYNSNRAPALELPSTISVLESEVLRLQPSSQDLDGDIIRYYFTEPMHKRKGIWETSYEDAGEYTIYVTATDGSSAQTLPVTVNVLQKNRQPAVLVPKDDYILLEGEEFVLPVGSIDPDNDSVVMGVEDLPEGASFDNNTFVWRPSYKVVASQKPEDSLLAGANLADAGSDVQEERWISVVASDHEFDVVHPVKLIVKNVNQKPEIRSFGPQHLVTLFAEQPFNFSVDALDADGDNLTYVWTFEPGAEKIFGSNAVERTFVNRGEKKVRVLVSDGFSEVNHEWAVAVSEKIQPEVDAVVFEEPKFKVYVIEH